MRIDITSRLGFGFTSIQYTLFGVATTTSTFSATTFVTATDRATNVGTGTFTVTRDTAPPTFTLSPAVESGALRVTWSSSDAASGVDASTCALEVREDEGAWQPFSTACAGDEIHSAAQPGHVYTFRLSATDNVSNTATAEALARFPRVTKYYYSGGQRVAQRRDGVVYYLHGDHLGSTSLTTNSSGGVEARQSYHPYGTVRYSEGTLPTDFGFTGQRGVPGTGLVFMHARYYHAGVGRFVSADTIVPEAGNPQALNRYSYAYNSPLVYVDADGHLPGPPWLWLVGGAAVLIIGAVIVDEALVEEGRIAVKHNAATIEAAANRYDVPPTMVAAGIAAQGNSYQRPFGLDVLEQVQMKWQTKFDPGNEPSVGIGQIEPSEALRFGVTDNPWDLFSPEVSIECMAAKLGGVDAAIADLAKQGITVSERDRWMAMMIAQNGNTVVEALYTKYEANWNKYLNDPENPRNRERDYLLPRVWEHMRWLKEHGWYIPPDVEEGIEGVLGGLQ